MITVTFNNDYEKAIAVLALRQFAQAQFQKAITDLTAGRATDGDDATRQGEKASEIATRIGGM